MLPIDFITTLFASSQMNLTDMEFIVRVYFGGMRVPANKKIVVMSWIGLLCMYAYNFNFTIFNLFIKIYFLKLILEEVNGLIFNLTYVFINNFFLSIRIMLGNERFESLRNSFFPAHSHGKTLSKNFSSFASYSKI